MWVPYMSRTTGERHKGVLRGLCKEPSPLSHLNYKISEKDVCRYTPNDSGSEEKVCFVLGGQRSTLRPPVGRPGQRKMKSAKRGLSLSISGSELTLASQNLCRLKGQKHPRMTP